MSVDERSISSGARRERAAVAGTDLPLLRSPSRPFPLGLLAAVRRLRCPVCEAVFRIDAGTLHCLQGHAFDVARQGYVHLGSGSGPRHADTAAMVAARERFLDGGHYDAIIDAATRAIVEAVGRCDPATPIDCRRVAESSLPVDGASTAHEARCVIDLGAGTGHYLAAVLRHAPGWDGVVVDASKPALRRAARAHPRIGAVVADAWGDLPIADGVASAVLSVFAPRGPGEMARVLRSDGCLIVVTPTVEHLHELVAALGLITVDAQKELHLARQLCAGFTQEHQRMLRWKMVLDHATIADLVGMGPSAWHVPAAVLKSRVGRLPAGFEVTVSVRVGTYRRRHRGPNARGVGGSKVSGEDP